MTVSRTICVMTLLRDFLQPNPHTAVLFSPFECIYQPTTPVPPFLLPLNQYPKEIAGSDITNCLTHTMYAIAFKAAWRVMQTLEIWADTKSCQDISRLFKDYLVRVELSRYQNLEPLGPQSSALTTLPPSNPHLLQETVASMSKDVISMYSLNSRKFPGSFTYGLGWG